MTDKKSIHWKTLKSEQGEDLRIFQVRYNWLQHPQNNTQLKATVLESNDATNVIAITSDKKMVLVEQFRFGTNEVGLELPGGFVDDNEHPLQAAERELREETAYTSTKWEKISVSDANPVFQNNRIHHWLAKDVALTASTHFDEGEAIRVVLLDISLVKKYLKEGKIRHPHSIVPLLRFFLEWV